MTAIEALTWGAFRTAMRYDDWVVSCHPLYEIWRRTNGRMLLHTLEARAAPCPYSPLFGHADRDWPPFLRDLRGRVRRGEGRLVTYADLAAMLRAELAAIEQRKAELRRAASELSDQILRTGKPSSMGKRDLLHARPDPGAPYEVVPREALVAPVTTITEDGRVFPDRSLPDAVWRPRMERGPTWSEVILVTCEVLLFWPPSKATPTIAVEKRLLDFLIDRMRAAPDSPPGKKVVRQEARDAGLAFSGVAFDRRYAEAVRIAAAPRWSDPGRKSKRVIEKAN